MAVTASAQVMDSYSYSKSKSNTMWYARIGMGIDNLSGGKMVNDLNKDNEYTEYSFGSRAGLEVDFGFQKPIKDFGLYWGMELGIGTRGASYKEKDKDDGDWTEGKGTAWNVKYSPFTFGYKYSVTDDLKIDAHIGAFVSYDFAGKKMKFEDSDGDTWDKDFDDLHWDYLAVDAGMQIGAGVWFKRFNLDFTYQRGFVPMFKPTVTTYTYNSHGYYTSSSSEEYSLCSSNFMIRLGVAF